MYYNIFSKDNVLYCIALSVTVFLIHAAGEIIFQEMS